MRDAVRAHYVTRWGEPSREARFSGKGLAIEVLKWAADANPEGVALYATVGASAYEMPGSDPTHRIELHLGLLPERDEVASALAALGLYGARNGVHLGPGDTVRADEPLWAGTEMRTLLVLRRPDILPVLVLPDGVHVEFLHAIPLYDDERAFKSAHGAEELLDRWEAADVPYWDPGRGSSATLLG